MRNSFGKAAAAFVLMVAACTSAPATSDCDPIEQLACSCEAADIKPINSTVNACAVPFRTGPGTQPFAFLCGANESDLDADKLEKTVGPRLRDTVQTLRLSLGIM